MNTLRFNEIDLEANREGRLSDAQIKKLDADLDTLRKQTRPKAVYFGVFFMLQMAVRLMLDHTGKKAGDGPFSDVGLTVMILVMSVLLGGFVFVAEWWSVRTLSRSKIHHIEGEVQVINKISRFLWWKTPIYRLKIWRNWLFRWKIFLLGDADSLAYFESGKRYRIYYLPYYDQPQALSCEEIDEKAKR